MCCGRLRRLTREKFRVSPPPPKVEKKEEPMSRVDPPNPPEICAECGSPVRKLMSCCSTTYRCTKYPVCKWKEMYDKEGEKR